MFESVQSDFRPKEAPFNVLPLTCNGEVSNWPDVMSLILKFRDIRVIDTGMDIHRSKFQGNRSVGVALTSIQTFYDVRSLDVTW